MTYNLDKGS